jgi:hypothetical protein
MKSGCIKTSGHAGLSGYRGTCADVKSACSSDHRPADVRMASAWLYNQARVFVKDKATAAVRTNGFVTGETVTATATITPTSSPTFEPALFTVGTECIIKNTGSRQELLTAASRIDSSPD